MHGSKLKALSLSGLRRVHVVLPDAAVASLPNLPIEIHDIPHDALTVFKKLQVVLPDPAFDFYLRPCQ